MRPGDMPRRPRASRRPVIARGYTFVALLVLMLVVTLGLSIAGPSWTEQVHRAREQELLQVGALYAQAIADYRASSPGSVKEYPRSLDDLVLDKRFLGVRRHLRRLYPDPMQPGMPWGLVQDIDGHVLGVYSLSDREPLITRAVHADGFDLAPARHYSDWKFVPVQPS